MKVLVISTVFAPSIGGMETVASLLVRGLTDEGHDVTVITCTRGTGPGEAAGTVVRRPSLIRTFRSVVGTDTVIMLGLTLKLGWPLLFLNRSTVVSHQVYSPPNENRVMRWLRNRLAARAKHIACSKAVAKTLERPCTIVGNPYEDGLFEIRANSNRDIDLAFLGRLVPEKGLDILLEALAILSKEGIVPTLTVAGTGPLRKELEATAARIGIANQVRFLGAVIGESLVNLLNAHRILVVPSSWEEPFGIVALEGVACGCAVIGSNGGGLPDAIGPCGVTFSNRDSRELAIAIKALLNNPAIIDECRKRASEHLIRHSPALVVREYLQCVHST